MTGVLMGRRIIGLRLGWTTSVIVRRVGRGCGRQRNPLGIISSRAEEEDEEEEGSHKSFVGDGLKRA
jgi:hypothetical protein